MTMMPDRQQLESGALFLLCGPTINTLGLFYPLAIISHWRRVRQQQQASVAGREEAEGAKKLYDDKKVAAER